ncbi:hypothetical protein M2152_002667 [Microbacteriaceae bacterium SG_E_30_P1]|uniref:Uncharacterized protein n=1 Tax=Antiquaquibacter oligotrophicus TaxID=2880260 RepID=A0ABT6KRR2_9MICO|nr:hypothetical protein [Antiquaquibacter oligotrophicus]MDH6182485.1 hypothetical protein [Antiquaquibacter oligotrophicus]UDF14546.1 hypothetical protein LH407_06700 [Antiquaquibacter oligotrophicus]
MKMPWRKKTQREGESGTSGLPLSDDEAEVLRNLFIAAWPSSRGPLAVFADYVRDERGAEFGLYNIAARLRQLPREDWDATVRHHVGTMVASLTQMTDVPGDDQLLSMMRSRLMPAEFAPPEALRNYSYARRVADDLVEVIMLDYPDTYASLTDEQAQRFSPDSMWGAARAGLSREPWGEIQTVETPGGSFSVLMGDSPFTASRVLDLDEFMERLGELAPLGVVIGVPHRHQLVFHVLKNVASIGSVNDVLRFTNLGFSDGIGPISPHIYFWKDGALDRISSVNTEGGLAINVSGRFSEAVEALTDQA